MAGAYDHVDLGTDSSGRPLEINERTQAMLDVVEAKTGQDVVIVQGSYMAGHGASASAGTHDGGGVIDIRTRDYTQSELDQVLLELRKTGFAAWYRTPEQGFDPHIHAVAIGDKDLDPTAQSQVEDYYNGLNGLADGGADDGPRVPIHVFQYTGDETAVTDAFAMDAGKPLTSTDADNDGLTDEFERLLHTDLHAADTDKDGLSDLRETTELHTDPLAADTNDDGVTDKQAVTHHLATGQAELPQEAVAAGFGGAASLDTDRDGLSDLDEAKLGSDATLADTDHDGLSDEFESRLSTSLTSLDSDHDGISDYAEAQLGTLDPDPMGGVDPTGGTGALDADSDDLSGLPGV